MIKKCLKKKVSINSLKLVFLLWKFPTCAMHLLWWGLTLKRKCSKLLKRFCTIATVEKGTWTWWKTCESNKLYLNLIKRTSYDFLPEIYTSTTLLFAKLTFFATSYFLLQSFTQIKDLSGASIWPLLWS